MKKVLLVALIIANTALYAQDAPASVLKSFKSKFPNAQDAEWSESDLGYEVEFYENEVSKTAIFSEDGKWVNTRTVLDEAPAVIVKAINAKYKGSSIEGITLIEPNDGNPFYEISASNEEASYSIITDKTGKILSSEEYSNDRDDSDYEEDDEY